MGDDNNEDAGTGSGGTMIPKDRLDREIAAKRTAQGRVGELEGRLTELEQQLATTSERAKTADTLATQFEALKAEHQIERASWDEERGIYRAGITNPEAIPVARLFHGLLPEEGRPSLGDWLGGFRDDPSKAPAGLQPYLGAPVATQQTTDTQRKAATTGASGTRQGTQQAATGGQWSAEAIRALSAEAAKTGNYDALKEAIQQYRGANGLPQRMK